MMLDISAYPAGVYILKVRFDNLVKTVKVLKNSFIWKLLENSIFLWYLYDIKMIL